MGSSCVCSSKAQDVANSQINQQIFQKTFKRQNNQEKKINNFLKTRALSMRSSIYISNREDIRSVYDFKETIGSGYSGKVRKVFLKANPSKEFVVKSISKDNLSLRQMNNLVKEVKLLSRLDHPNIIKYYETYDDEEEFHIVMTYCTGGELFDYLRARGNLSEKETAKIIYQILHGIAHCHAKSIVHRDLKAENVLFESTSHERIKIIDFGLSKKIYAEHLHSLVGTAKYISPELIKGDYNYKCDIWSIGIICYLLLYGEYPFDDETNDKQKIFNKILNEEPYYNDTLISQKANDFIKHLLKKSADERYDAETALKNEWLIEMIKNEFTLNLYNDLIISKLQQCIAPTSFIKILLSFIIKEIDINEIQNIRKQFYLLGDTGTGTINIKKYSSSMTPKMMAEGNEEILTGKNINLDDIYSDGLKSKRKSGCEDNTTFTTMNNMDYTSFVIASLKNKNMLDEQVIRNVFNRFDCDGVGVVTIDDIDKGLRRIGKKYEREQIEKMLKESGFINIDNILFEDFYKVFNMYL